MRYLIQCLIIFFIFASTALASGWDGNLEPRMKVREHIQKADAVLVGRFSGNFTRFIFDGYDKNRNPKKRIFSTPFNLLKEKFGFPLADWEMVVDEVLYLKNGFTIDKSITFRDISNFEAKDSKKNQKYQKKLMEGRFLLFLRTTRNNEAYTPVSKRSLIKLDESNVVSVIGGTEYEIYVLEETTEIPIDKPQAFVEQTKTLIEKHKKDIMTLDLTF